VIFANEFLGFPTALESQIGDAVIFGTSNAINSYLPFQPVSLNSIHVTNLLAVSVDAPTSVFAFDFDHWPLPLLFDFHSLASNWVLNGPALIWP
jgi:hypothetical protein